MTGWQRIPSRGEWILLSLPLVILLIDFILSPHLIENSAGVNQISLVSLLEQRHLTLGTFHGHEIEVNVGRVAQQRYLDYLAARRPNALAISSFIGDDDNDDVMLGEFGRSLLRKLKVIAPPVAARLEQMLSEGKAFVPGDVRDFPLDLSPEQRPQLPVDHVLIAVMERGNGGHNTDFVAELLPHLLQRAAIANVETLVLPIIGYNWQDDHPITFSDFFRALLESAMKEFKPPRIVVDLYSSWPTFVLENGVAELNAAAEQFEKPPDAPRLHRQQIRTLYLLITICLLASSFFVRITFKTALIVAVAYTGLFLGAGKMLEFLTSEWPPRLALLTTLGVDLFLAALFPVVVRWRASDLFASPPRPGEARS